MGKTVDVDSIKYLMIRKDLLQCGISVAYVFGALYALSKMRKRKKVRCSYKLLMDITRLTERPVWEALYILESLKEIVPVSCGSGNELIYTLKEKDAWSSAENVVVNPHMLNDLEKHKRSRHGLVIARYVIKRFCDLGDSSTCYAKSETLAKWMGVSDRTWRRYKDTLLAEDYIKEAGWGRNWIKRYTVYMEIPAVKCEYTSDEQFWEELKEHKRRLSELAHQRKRPRTQPTIPVLHLDDIDADNCSKFPVI